MRTARVEYNGDRILLIAVDLDLLAALARPQPIAGDPSTMFRVAANGKAVIGSESLASLRHLKVGDQIASSYANRAFCGLPLVGLVREYSDQQGEVFLDRTIYKDTGVMILSIPSRVYLKPGANPDRVRSAILSEFSGKPTDVCALQQ